MIISFDTINFQWEQRDGHNNLVIYLKDIGSVPETTEEKFELQAKIQEKIKEAVNDHPIVD